VKETRYHVRYATSWVVRLGDGTLESRARVQTAIDELWPLTTELFAADGVDEAMALAGVAPLLAHLKSRWSERIDAALREATLTRPADSLFPWHGKRGVHTEHLGYMLAEMQFLQRAYPGAQW
jgi:ring-1,2-phenylacetyl-CoA epoxidase subunit PaaC